MSLARVMVSATVVLIGCGAGEPLVAPRPLGQITMDPPQPEVVVCPVGSAYDAARHVCVATQSIAQPDPEPEPEPPPAVVAAPAEGGIRVTCGFANGWVSVMPVSKYPRDDQFLMQALIGLTDEPQFWKDRIPVSGVPVKGGRVRLRVVEAEREVTHLDRLALEIDGVTVLPLPGSRSALAAEDGVEVEMARGRVIELSFDVSGKADGTLAAVVVATGYYEPRDD